MCIWRWERNSSEIQIPKEKKRKEKKRKRNMHGSPKRVQSANAKSFTS